MTFYTQGLNSHELMPLVQLFNKKSVERTHRTEPKHRIDSKRQTSNSGNMEVQHTGIAIQSYHDVEHIPQSEPKLNASQIMSINVITLNPDDTLTDAIKLFKEKKFRHIPIVVDDNVVVGILSERDVLHYLSGTTDDYAQQKSPIRNNEKIHKIMKSKVLTASRDTDVRFIARLFVEQNMGAMPIVNNGSLVGFVTRNDVLVAVMRNFILELWA